MQESIDLDTLPRTFRDAIEVTRNLKMKYLWIDSFCIIQDSAENWEQESAVMGDIYENCVFNIAATGASDGEDGMVYTRTPILAQPLLVNAWSTSPLEERSACSSRKSTLFLLSTFSMWRRNILFAALNTRGWGLQERILAPRTIHFTRTQLFWECAELSACQTFPDGVLEWFMFRNEWNYINSEPTLSWKSLKPSPAVLSNFEANNHAVTTTATRLWHEIVDIYSSLQLTMENDILVAISGIAKRMKPFMGEEYLPGLWKSSLEYDLLWRARPMGRPEIITWGKVCQGTLRPTHYRAPSWSWASVNAQCELTQREWKHPVEKTFIRLLNSKIVPKSQDITGGVLAAHLTSRCWLKSFAIRDWSLAYPDSRDHLQFFIGKTSTIYGIATFDDRLDEQFDFPREQLLMPIMVLGAKIHGIMLAKTEINQSFRRIGYFRVRYGRWEMGREEFPGPNYGIFVTGNQRQWRTRFAQEKQKMTSFLWNGKGDGMML